MRTQSEIVRRDPVLEAGFSRPSASSGGDPGASSLTGKRTTGFQPPAPLARLHGEMNSVFIQETPCGLLR